MTIVKSEEVRGGKPVIAGTRVAVEDVVERFYVLGRGTKSISEDLDVSVEEVEEALRYHHDEVLDGDVSRVEA